MQIRKFHQTVALLSAHTTAVEGETEELNRELKALLGVSSERSPPTESRPRLTHVDTKGTAFMVDVSEKQPTLRQAIASAKVRLGGRVFELVQENKLKKGDVLTVAQIAGVMAAKQTPNLIPLCHPLSLTNVDVKLKLNPKEQGIDIAASASTVGPTGVEMEALMAASVAALTVYDMCKAASKDIEISEVKLMAKSGGTSGAYRRDKSEC